MLQITLPSSIIPTNTIPGGTIVFSDSFIGDGLLNPIDIKPLYLSDKFIGTGSSPTDKLDINIPSISDPKIFPYVEKTANYTVTLNDYTINCLTNSFTVTLPSAIGIAGRVFIIKNSTVGTSITVKGAIAGQTIDDVSAKVLTSRTALRVQSTGTKYIII